MSASFSQNRPPGGGAAGSTFGVCVTATSQPPGRSPNEGPPSGARPTSRNASFLPLKSAKGEPKTRSPHIRIAPLHN